MKKALLHYTGTPNQIMEEIEYQIAMREEPEDVKVRLENIQRIGRAIGFSGYEDRYRDQFIGANE